MIFYTLQGPKFKLEVHETKIKLAKKSWWPTVSREPTFTTWEIDELVSFEMTPPRFLILGKLQWESKNGHKGSFRFSTNAHMVKKIERYLQERISKQEERLKAPLFIFVAA